MGEVVINSGAGSINSAVLIVVLSLLIIMCIVLVKLLNTDLTGFLFGLVKKLMRFTAKGINDKEQRYYRELTIGKINEKNRKVKIYRFLNDLIIDLGLKKRGATVYEFLTLVIITSLTVSLIACEILFGNLLMLILVFPFTFIALLCGLYTKANLAHDNRIEEVLTAENIISNNIKDGVKVSVRNSLDLIPFNIRGEFSDFLDNLEFKGYHIRTALLELNNNLGSISDDFIKKCIVFELEEEHGTVGVFRDVVEVNNIKTDMRVEMKRQFELVVRDFTVGALMIFVFIGGTIAIYPEVANFYFNTTIGSIIIALDALILVGEFVYITNLKAVEL